MPSLAGLRLFFDEAAKLRRHSQGGPSAWALLRFFPAWQRAQRPQASPLADRQPWITFPAIAFLRRRLTPQMVVFEYGSGGSTLFFAQRAGEIVSTEHDPAWAAKVRETLAQRGVRNIRLELVEPEPALAGLVDDPADPALCLSSAECYRGKSFRNYVSRIDSWPDSYFDFILVDGRARPSCITRAAPKLRRGGWLLLDNTEREHYHRAAAALRPPAWRKRDFSGPGPYLNFFWRTWAWHRL
ncbi:MAG TPA: hypothetical protein VG146_23190 [Verrucomicrobiae bacterium]|nr:hypothetical protein [Verrucomicrobiae bacterium]